MRKGRSQRKTRSSLPPLGARSHTSCAGAEASPTSRGPQVVIGITGPLSSDGEVGESREARGFDRQPVLELADREPPVLELADREPPVDSLAPAVVSERRSQHEIVADPFALALSEETPIPVSSEIERPHVVSIVTPGELSIPPMGDLSVEPIAERFFSEGELAAAGGDEEDESWSAAPDNAQRKSLPHVVERRQRFSRYVRWAVSGAAVVCLAALARTAIIPHRAPSASAGAAKTAIQVEAVALPTKPTDAVAMAAPVVAPESVQAPKFDVPTKAEVPAAVAPAEAPKADDAKLAAAAAPAKGEDAKPASPAVATGDKTAPQEKVDARRNLERGKLVEAIEAGERSVALDPQDGEAWLLLGAAYQEKGKNAEARRCYKACLSEGKRGPLGECRAMLH